MNISLPAPLVRLGEAFRAGGFSLYAVGGLVRNPLLGLPASDWDVCTDALPEEAAALGERAGLRAVPKAPAFGTIEFLGGTGSEPFSIECTTFRADTYGPGGNHRPQGVRFSKSLAQDAARRDFTVNALYADTGTGELIDPTGGLADLEHRVLRATNRDAGLILRDDGLRILRMVRFACELGFSIHPATYAAAENNVSGLLDLPAERLWQEFSKILLSDARYHAAQPDGSAAHYRGLLLLRDLGALYLLLPPLKEGEGIPQRPEYHAYTVLMHGLHACECAPPTLALRLAALLHDVGKPFCLAKNGRMLGHDREGARIAAGCLQNLKCPGALVERVALLIDQHMFDLDGRAKTPTLRKRILQWGPEVTLELAALREADFIGSGLLSLPIPTADRWRQTLASMEKEGAPFSIRELRVTGREIMEELGLPPGPQVGMVKQALWLHCAVRPSDNQKKRLLRLSHGIALSPPGGDRPN